MQLELLVKCSKCDYSNPITSIECTNCSTIINSAIQYNAVVCVEFSNYKQIQQSFNDNVSFETFMNNLYSIIQSVADKYGIILKKIKPELVSIKFNNQKFIEESYYSAVNFALKIVEYMRKINKELQKSNYLTLKVRIGITTVSIFDRRADARIELSIFTKEPLEIIVHPQIYKYTEKHYKYESLITVVHNNEFLMFYKLIHKKDDEKDNNQNEFNQDSYEDLLYKENNIDKIYFSSKKSKKYIVKSSKLQILVKDLIEKTQQSCLFNIISDNKKKIWQSYLFQYYNHILKIINLLMLVVQKQANIILLLFLEILYDTIWDLEI